MFTQYTSLGNARAFQSLGRLLRFAGSTLSLAAAAASVSCASEHDFYDANGEPIESIQEAVISGTNTMPAPDWSQPAVGRLFLPGNGTCTATLIHKHYAITAAHCTQYPVAAKSMDLRFRDTAGNDLPLEEYDGTPVTDTSGNPIYINPVIDVQMWPIVEPLPTTPWDGTPLNTDVALVKLKYQVQGVNPLKLAASPPSQGATVTTHGYGGFGTTSCTQGIDGNKRSRSWSYGATTFPVCGGDSGGPTLDPSGNIIAVTGSSGVLGDPLMFREELFQAMQSMEGTDIVLDVGRSGTVASTPTTHSAEECELECAQSSSCRSWHFRAPRSCTLHSRVGTWAGVAGQRSVWSGLRPLALRGFKFTGNSIKTESGPNAGPEQCAGLCGTTSGCVAFNYSSLASCELLSSVTGTSTNSSYMAGRRIMTEGSTDRFGGDYATTSVSSSGDCWGSCSSDWQCKSASYVNGTCFLKRHYAEAQTQSGVSSRVKRANSMPGKILTGTPLSGWNLADITPPIEETCRVNCQSRSSCEGYSVRKALYGSPMKCTLFSDVTDSNPSSNFVSGYRGLTFF